MTFSHVGIAVPADSPMYALLALLGVPTSDTTVPKEKLAVRLGHVGAHEGRIELLRPVDPDSTIGRFLAKHGPGLHHVCLAVGSGELPALCTKLRDHGYRLIFEQCELGAEGTPVNFVHPKSTGGILVEFQERPA